jgi:predicted TIM-barrel fold metal-dependent hydrolase
MIHLMNIVINGIPERFPGLKVMFMEGGLAWIPFLMQRLDSEYMMRTSEAPMLTKRPSEYMREFYYSTQPMERPDDLSILEKTFAQLDARNRLVFSSDYPHWDFDLPSVIYDLPFLDEESKERILGRNAMELFGLPEPKVLLP